MRHDPAVPSVEGFWLFVNLRMEAYELRKAGLRSDDPVLASGWYPNVKRELDKGTVYFQEQVRGREREVIPLSIVYRLPNRRQTFEAYGGIPSRDNLRDFVGYLLKGRAQGVTIFTGNHQTIGLSRYLQTLAFLQCPFAHQLATLRDAIVQGETPEESRKWPWQSLKDFVPGVANFSSWQILCDTMETLKLSEDVWAYMGPGPQGAYQMIHAERGTQAKVLAFARRLRVDTRNEHGLTLKNIEHALCEYFRYTRAWWGR